MNKAERIRQARLNANLTLEELAEKCQTTKQTIYKYEQGIVTNIPTDRIEQIASATGCSPEYLMGWGNTTTFPSGALHVVKRALPVLGKIACGEPVASDQVTFDSVEEVPEGADYALYAEGDSMTGARIYDGDLVFIRQQSQVDNGDIAAVSIDGEITLKRFYYYEETQTIQLMPENPAYRPMVFTGTELKLIQVLGKAVSFKGEIK